MMVTAILAKLAGPQDDPLKTAAQEYADKKYKIILEEGQGFVRHRWDTMKGKLKCQTGNLVQPEDINTDVHQLWKEGKFSDVGYTMTEDATVPKHVRLRFWVKEYPTVSKFVLLGARAEDAGTLYREKVLVREGTPLDPYFLRVDQQTILSFYRQRGNHLCQAEHQTSQVGQDVVLTWRVFEGPIVNVDEIAFTGKRSFSDGEIRSWMQTKENGFLSKNPYVERVLQDDLERIKRQYRLEGFLDIYEGNQVFLQEVRFSPDKREARIVIHIDESRRFKVRQIQIRGNAKIPEAELREELTVRPGDPLSELQLFLAQRRLFDAYGERGYINAEVDGQWIVVGGSDSADVIFTIKENERCTIARVLIQGNTKTKEPRIRLDLRDDLVPGGEFNAKRVQRAVQRLEDRGIFDQARLPIAGRFGEKTQGVKVDLADADPNDKTVKDVILNVKEGATTRIQLAAGFSSSFGVMGLIEYTQSNFDISDIPRSFAEIPTAFTGAGQTLRIRLSPGAQLQMYTMDFLDPYFFGMEVSFATGAFLQTLIREAWEEEDLGGVLRFRKFFGQYFSSSLGMRGLRRTIFNVDATIGTDLQNVLELFPGSKLIVAAGPGVTLDTRDSVIIPTEGVLAQIDYEIAWAGFGSDINFNKIVSQFQFHIPLYRTESKARHVLSLLAKGAWVSGFSDTPIVPIDERFFAGGRGAIRGFAYRGIGDRIAGVPVGGEALVVGTVEYTIPLYQHILYGAIWYDVGTLSADIRNLPTDFYRQSIGFGFRFVIPQFGNIPIALDFGWTVASRSSVDREQIFLLDLGRFTY